MRKLLTLITIISASGLIAFTGYARPQEQFFRFANTTCTPAPYMHCPDSECSGPMVINQGNVVEMKTRRTYFLDYPCDLKPGEKVTFILSLHGAGSYGNWQRNYFPIMDYKDKYRLVIATPNSPTRVWSEADDQYLHNIVDFVTEQIGRENIKAFWLVGQSQGGMTSNRIIRTDYFKDKVDGWLSLSGGRLGGNPGRGATFAPTGPAPGAAPAGAAPAAPGAARPGAPAANPAGAPSGMAATMAALREPPTNDFSFIYETGRREMDDKGLPETSEWAKKYNCGTRSNPQDVVDSKAGYVYDSSRLNQLRPGWGLLPAPGKAQVYTYPDCKDGRVVADVVRLDKGHTEGLEPKVTEELVKMMVSAKGGKMQQMH